MPAERVVYLLGAGATIAEAFYAGIEQNLTLRAVSELVVEKVKEDMDLQKIFGYIATDAIPDVEIYISLLESMRIQRFSDAASKLKSLFCDIIEEKLLQDNQPIEPVLTMALLQMHEVEELKTIEQLRGIVTVNYDNLIDRSFQEVQKGVNYCIKCKCISGGYHLKDDGIPLIKLHGSFNWKSGFP